MKPVDADYILDFARASLALRRASDNNEGVYLTPGQVKSLVQSLKLLASGVKD